jgi:hypothetical protein
VVSANIQVRAHDAASVANALPQLQCFAGRIQSHGMICIVLRFAEQQQSFGFSCRIIILLADCARLFEERLRFDVFVYRKVG